MSNEKFRTSIGGQALIEGVMMRGPQESAMAVRMPNGEIDIETWEEKPQKWYNKTPFLRGSINFVTTMIMGYKTLMKSAEKAGFDDTEEISDFERKMIDKLGDKFWGIIMAFAGVIGSVLAVVLFTLVPSFIGGLIVGSGSQGIMRSLTEGLIRILIFIIYVWAVSKVSDVKRVYQYHGAEHKSIACYESGDDLTPENAKKHSRFHPRCGTNFIMITLIVSIIVFAVVKIDIIWLRMVLKLLMLPVIVGISYEVIKLVGRRNNPITRIIATPGMLLQRLTTAEPDMDQLEVAIASLLAAIPKDGSADKY